MILNSELLKKQIKSLQIDLNNLKRKKDTSLKEQIKLIDLNIKKSYNLLFKCYSENIVKSDNRRYQIECCGEFLSFLKGQDENLKKLQSERNIIGYNYKLIKATFCRHRLCNMCMWRKSVADGLKIQTIFNYVVSQKDEHKRNKYKLLFLTLTVNNCAFDELESTIDRINKAFLNLVRNKKFKSNILGTIKKIEITFNHKTQTWHPHVHCILLVDDIYADLNFKNKDVINDKRFTKIDNYITRDEFLEMWQRAYNDYSITQVDVRAVKDNKKASKELSKYVAKASNLINCDEDDDYNINILSSYYLQTYNKRFLTFSGLFKELNKSFKDRKLDAFLPIDSTEYTKLLECNFNNHNYDFTTRDLTEDEKVEYLNKSTYYTFDYSEEN